MKSERAIRDTSAAAQRQEHGPSRHLLVVDEGTLAIVAEGLITASLQMQAREMVALLEAGTLGRPTLQTQTAQKTNEHDEDECARGPTTGDPPSSRTASKGKGI